MKTLDDLFLAFRWVRARRAARRLVKARIATLEGVPPHPVRLAKGVAIEVQRVQDGDDG